MGNGTKDKGVKSMHGNARMRECKSGMMFSCFHSLPYPQNTVWSWSSSNSGRLGRIIRTWLSPFFRWPRQMAFRFENICKDCEWNIYTHKEKKRRREKRTKAHRKKRRSASSTKRESLERKKNAVMQKKCKRKRWRSPQRRRDSETQEGTQKKSPMK